MYMEMDLYGAMMITHITYRSGPGRIFNQPSRLIGIRPGSVAACWSHIGLPRTALLVSMIVHGRSSTLGGSYA